VEPGKGEAPVAALLSGCVTDDWFGPVHLATIAVLRRAGYRVVVPDDQTCCGALAAHEGRAAEAEALLRRNVDAFRGADVVVTNSAGCGAHLADAARRAGPSAADLAARVRDITEVAAEAIGDGRLPELAPTGEQVAVQDPCHLRHALRVIRDPRVVVEAAGHDVVDIDPDGLCCGAAGVYGVLRPDTSAALGERMAGLIRATGATVVASANPGCEMQLRAHLGPGYRVAHPVELYAERLEES
jgi:glycolate oxidase iron-sulfur subunit